MEKNFRVEFNQCPNCGSSRRFCEKLGEELKERRMARPDWTFNYDVKTGIVMDKVIQAKVLTGTSLPGFLIHADICMDCGTIYAVRLARLEGEVRPQPLPKHPPIMPPSSGSPLAS